MTQLSPPARLMTRPDAPTLAIRHRPAGHLQLPTILFLPGYASDMDGTKAVWLDDWAGLRGIGCLRFDYRGCGLSEGAFEDATLADWLEDALAVVAGSALGRAPLLLVGSSMGGWLMLHVAHRLALAGRTVAGLVGIAAAPDFTAWDYDEDDRAVMARDGRLLRLTPYGPDPMVTTDALWRSGEALLCLDAMPALVPAGGPPVRVRLMHGLADPDVPVAIAHRLMGAIGSPDVQLTLIKDGDHRLSRPAHLALLGRLVDEMVEPAGCP